MCKHMQYMVIYIHYVCVYIYNVHWYLYLFTYTYNIYMCIYIHTYVYMCNTYYVNSILLLYLCFSSYVSLMRVAHCTFRHGKCRYRVSCFWTNVPRIWAEFIYHRCCIGNLKNQQFIFSKVLPYISVLRPNKDWKDWGYQTRCQSDKVRGKWLFQELNCFDHVVSLVEAELINPIPLISNRHILWYYPLHPPCFRATGKFFTLLNLP